MENQWIDSLRKRFTDRRTTPPDGLWEGIINGLPQSDKPATTGSGNKKRQRGIYIMWRRAAAVAAVAAVTIMGVRYLSNFSEDKQTDIQGDYTNNVGTHGSCVRNDIADNILKSSNNGLETKRTHETHVPTLSEKSPRPLVSDDTSAEIEESPCLLVSCDSSAEKKKPYGNKSVGVSDYTANHNTIKPKKRKNSKNVSVAVYGSGTTAFGNLSSYNGYNDLYSAAQYNTMLVNNTMLRVAAVNNNRNEEENEVNVNHRQPIKLGASVRFNLNDRLGVGVGANYSYHKADIASGNEKGGYTTEQKLHYVGVPVSLNYDIWRNSRLSIYASAGGEVEFCVSGKSHTEHIVGNSVVRTDDDKIRDDRPQWSVNASAGVQYDFNDFIGVYAEPGVSYHFDNGTDVKTIYKDKPFNFNLNVGIRFTVK